MDGEKNITNKLTLEEYKAKYTKPENPKMVKFGLVMLIGVIGIIIFTCLFFTVLRVFEINEIAGYISIGIAVLIFIFLYIVPMVQIHKHRPFMTNINSRTASKAKKYNRQLRNEIADMMIDFTSKVEGANWYNDELVGKLAIARQTNDNKGVRSTLTEIYGTSVKKQADKIISTHALKVGLITAASQSDKLDAAFVAVYELNLIKDLVYLYWFRPSDVKLLKIYRNVIVNSLLAYGVSSSSTSLISKGLQATFEGLPLLGTLVSTAIGSVSQGVINGAMTCVIGVQTKKYLIKEYRLQDILDDIQLDDDEEDKKLLQDVTKEISDNAKKKKKTTEVVQQ